MRPSLGWGESAEWLACRPEDSPIRPPCAFGASMLHPCSSVLPSKAISTSLGGTGVAGSWGNLHLSLLWLWSMHVFSCYH